MLFSVYDNVQWVEISDCKAYWLMDFRRLTFGCALRKKSGNHSFF